MEALAITVRDIFEISREIEVLEEQMRPMVERLKVLKKERDDRKKEVLPQMKVAQKKEVQCGQMNVKYKPVERMRPYNEDLVKNALALYFQQRQIAVPIDEVMNYIKEFRSANKVTSESVAVGGFVRKRADKNVDASQVMNIEMQDGHVTMAANNGPQPTIAPFVFGQ